MNILYINNTSVLTPGGGGEDRMDEISKRLVNFGHDVVILSGRTGANLEKWEESEGREIRHVRCVPDMAFRFPTFAYYTTRYLFAFACIPALMKILLSEEFDVVIENMTPYPTFSVIVAHIFNVPITAIQHEFFDRSAFDVYDPITASILLAVQNFHRYFPYTALIVPSSHVKHQFKNYGISEDKIYIIPNGIDVKKYQQQNVEREKGRLIVLGRLMKRKGHDHIIRAARILVKDGYDVHLDIVGKGSMRKHLEQLTDSLKLSKHVTFHGYVSEKKKVELLKRANLFLFASNQEGFGIALLEAMAAGTPVVAYRLPVYETFFEDEKNGLLVHNREPKSLARAVKRLLDDSIATQKIREKNIETAKEYSWETSAHRMETLLQDIQ